MGAILDSAGLNPGFQYFKTFKDLPVVQYG
jgi:hypothetical protein